MARNIVGEKNWLLTPVALYIARQVAWELLKERTVEIEGRPGIDLDELSIRTKMPNEVLRRQVLHGWEDVGANKLLAPQAIARRLPKVQIKNMGWIKAKLEGMHILDEVLRLPSGPFMASGLDPKIPRLVLRYLQKIGLIVKIGRAPVKGTGAGMNVYKTTGNYIKFLEYLDSKPAVVKEDEIGKQEADREGDQSDMEAEEKMEGL